MWLTNKANCRLTQTQKGIPMKSFLLFLGLVGIWLILAGFVLPRLGIRTCLSGSCKHDSHSGKEKNKQDKESES
jgi:hypothetical protein